MDSDSRTADESPIPKRKRLSLSLKKHKTESDAVSEKENDPAPTFSRFTFLTDEEETSLAKKCVPKNTAAMTKWAVSNFLAWRTCRNEKFQGNEAKQVPSTLFESSDPTLLSNWLSLYCAEARKQDGGPYPPKTLYALLCGILRHMRSLNVDCPNFLDFTDPRFATLQNSLDNLFRDLRARGVGSESRSAEVFSKEEEDQLWSTGVLSVDTPKGLLRAVFYLNGKNFALRGGVEHRQLKLSQIKRVDDPPSYVYTECASKNRAGGLAQLRVKNKVVPIHAVPEAGERCHVYILDQYLEKIPKEAFEKENFYLQPVSKLKDPAQPWFSCVPVGRNMLSKMVKSICEDASVGGQKTNHSLRATGATEMYHAGVPEKVMLERTGHLSLAGLRQYERTSSEQQEKVSRILSCRENTFYQTSSRAQSSCLPTISLSNCTNCNVSIGITPHLQEQSEESSTFQIHSNK